MGYNKMKGGVGNCSGSGSQWQMENVGDLSSQTSRVFNSSSLGNSINTIGNVNADNNWPPLSMKGGKTKHHRKLKGGNYGAIAYEALAPGILMAAQNMYKSKSSKYRGPHMKKRFLTKKNNKRKLRGGNYGAIAYEALAPGILMAAQNMYKPTKSQYRGPHMKKRFFTKKNYKR
jgi:hypothetical protein